MKPSKPLRRKTSLKADAEKVREFLQRGRGQLERTPLRARPKDRPAEGPLSPAAWRVAVFDASDGVCIMTGTRARYANDRRFHAHHALDKSELRARGLFGHVWDPRNGVWLRRDVHVRHEDAFEKVPHTALPRSVWEFCAELDALGGTEWATQRVLRDHPVRG